jgi:hypothetical protein
MSFGFGGPAYRFGYLAFGFGYLATKECIFSFRNELAFQKM